MKPAHLLLALAGIAGAPALPAQSSTTTPPTDAAALARKLQNPVADLITAPIQNNWDFGIGPAGATRYTANIQPIIPISVSEDWNVITRTILPVIHAESPVVGGPAKSGLGDTLQSFFLSPQEPLNDWVLGAGPVCLYPTATDDALGGGKFGLGPTAVALRQHAGWTYGTLANHVWSVAGEGGRPDLSTTFVQPFVLYTTRTLTTFGVNLESSRDWERDQWNVPVNVVCSQLLKVGRQPVQLTLGGRYYAERPAGGPDWGLRFMVTFLFPSRGASRQARDR
ncbi:MAG: hypothetical protein RJA22_3201 [Verrucomicrobiota bacterium]